MIYVDTDTIFLGPVDDLWGFFSHFNDTQISAMTLEDDNPNISWYPRFAKHPFYGKYGTIIFSSIVLGKEKIFFSEKH